MIRFFYLFVILMMMSLIYSCTKQSEITKQLPERPLPVRISEVSEQDVPIYVEAIGNVGAFNQVDVRPQVNGKVIEVYVEGGQDVHIGDPLYQIDPIPYQIALDKAKATLVKDEAQLEFTRQKLERYQHLVKNDFVSKLSIEEYVSQVKAQEGQVMIDRAEVNLAQVHLNYCLVTSPIEGRVSLNRVDIGNLVTSNDLTMLTRILQITPVYVHFAISQKEFQNLKQVLAEGNRYFQASLPFGNQYFDGEVIAVDNQMNLQTGTIQFKGVILNRDKTLWPGEFVRIRLLVGLKEKMAIIPSSALQINQQGEFVYVLQLDKTVKKVPVKTGEKFDDFVAIEEGLKPGMQVVTDGQINLHSDVKVIVINEKAMINEDTQIAEEIKEKE